MGFSIAPECSLASDIPQMPQNIYRVRVLAGWTYQEAADQLGIDTEQFEKAEHGFRPLADSVWRQFLDKAGKRAFDYEPR